MDYKHDKTIYLTLRCRSKHKELMCHFHLSINWCTLIKRKAALFSVTDTQIYSLPISSEAVYHKEQWQSGCADFLQQHLAVSTVWLQIPPSLLCFHPYLSADESSKHLQKIVLMYVCLCLCVPTKEPAVPAYLQPQFLTSLMNLQRATTCNHSCLVLSILFRVFSFLVSFLLFSCCAVC